MRPQPDLSLVVALGFAGLISALLVICAPSGNDMLGYFFPGTLFGATLSACLWLCRVVRVLWKLAAITLLSSIALPISILISTYLEVFSPWPLHTPGTPIADTSSVALFAGGVSGSFLLLATLLLIVGSERRVKKALFRALCWSLLGGVLGVIGWNLGPWLGNALWSLQHSLNLTQLGDKLEYAVVQGRTNIKSMLLVWQTGMGLLLGIALRNSLKEARVPERQVFNS